MSSLYKCGTVEHEAHAVNLFPSLCHDDVESFFAEQSEVEKEVKLSYMLRRLDDTFSTEDRWPI